MEFHEKTGGGEHGVNEVPSGGDASMMSNIPFPASETPTGFQLVSFEEMLKWAVTVPSEPGKNRAENVQLSVRARACDEQ